MAQEATTELLTVYLVTGEDQLKRERVVERLKKRMSQLGDISFNSDEFNGERATGEQIVAAANTLPFASEKRLVLVHAVDKLKKAEVDQLVSYLQQPCESTVLCLVGNKVAKNTRLYKACAALGNQAIVDCTPFARRDLGSVVRGMAKGHGVEFTPGAASTLIDLVGTNTVTLDNEIRKVSLAHRGVDPVNENEIIALVSRTTEIGPWEVVDAFAGRNVTRCVHISQQYMEGVKASPLVLLSMCTNRLRELITYKALMERGAEASALEVLGFPPNMGWKLKNHRAWANGYSQAELEQAIIAARDAERTMKSSPDERQYDVFLDWAVGVMKR